MWTTSDSVGSFRLSAWTRTTKSVGFGRTQLNPASWQAIPRFQGGSWLGFVQMRTRETDVR